MLDPRAFFINNKTGRVVATTFIEFLSGNSTTPSICFTDSPDSGLQCDSNGVVNYIKNGVNQGEIGPGTLDDLKDVDLTTTPPADGEALVYDSATGDWVPGAAGGGTPGGTTGQIQWNSSGSFAGISGSAVGATGDITLSLNGAASTPPVSLTGTWFSGGTSTTTKPQFLIEPTGTTSTAWNTSGTGLGINAPSGFTGNLLDLQVDGATKLYYSAQLGRLVIPGTGFTEAFQVGGTRIRFDNAIVAPTLVLASETGGTYRIDGSGVNLRESRGVRWYPNNVITGSPDVEIARSSAGVVSITNGSTGTGYLKQTPVAVSALPSAATVGAGTRGFVSDSTVAASGNFGATVTGGGSNNVPVFSDGTNWLIG